MTETIKKIFDRPTVNILLVEDHELLRTTMVLHLKNIKPNVKVFSPGSKIEFLGQISAMKSMSQKFDIALVGGRTNWGDSGNVIFTNFFSDKIKEVFPDCLIICTTINEDLGRDLLGAGDVHFCKSKNEIIDWLRDCLSS